MNNFKIEIYNNQTKQFENYSKAYFSIKFANLLDEQLDEAEISLKRVSTAYFMPMTRVRITLENSPDTIYSDVQSTKLALRNEQPDINIIYTYASKRITETLTKEFIIANDNAIEQPVGSGKYNHQLYLIELTKIAEGFIGDSISFTNALGNDYLGE